MHKVLEITEAADDLQLLTVEEMRVAAGLDPADESKDAILQARGLGIAAAICDECDIAVGNGGEPTLKQETLTETFYRVRSGVHSHQYVRNGNVLLLSRRHNVQITSITMDGISVPSSDYIVDAEAGIVTKLCGRWHCGKLVVVYKAGFDTVPGELKMAAIDFFSAVTAAVGRDPFVKSESTEVPGVEVVTKNYWVGSVPGAATEDAVPDVVAGQLKRFRNVTSIG